MRILFGVLTPDAGTSAWDGLLATEADRRSWGYMPPERGLYRDMRVLDQLRWIALLHGLDKAAGPPAPSASSSDSVSATAPETRCRISPEAWRRGRGGRRGPIDVT